MVKVVGRDETEVKRITCKNCASILEYTNSEVKSMGNREGYYYISCPECDKQVLTGNFG